MIDKELLPGFIRWSNWVLLKYLFYLQSIKLLTGTFSNQSWSYLGPYLGSPWGPVQCSRSPGPTISLPHDSVMGQLTRSALVELGMCFHLNWSPGPPRVLSSKCSILPWISSPMLISDIYYSASKDWELGRRWEMLKSCRIYETVVKLEIELLLSNFLGLL